MLRATEEPSSTGEPMDEEADAMAVVSSSAVMELRVRQQRA